MSIGISDEHVELARSLRRWAARWVRRGGARRRGRRRTRRSPTPGRPSSRWACATIGLPEAAGGGGGSVLDEAVALEACAHELVPGPLLGDRGRRAAGARPGRRASARVRWSGSR